MREQVPHQETVIPSAYVQSLVWANGTLLDPIACSALNDDKWERGGRSYAGIFDAAIVSPSGRYSVIFTRLGTKAIVLKDGEFVREINRSYYKSEAYEYPVTIAQMLGGREVLIHCPDEYNVLQAEDIETGEVIQRGFHPKPIDFFHSCLCASPDQRFLISAGWVWHPFCTIELFERQPDGQYMPAQIWGDHRFLPTDQEVGIAQFLDSDTLCIATTDGESLDPDHDDPAGIGPNAIALWSIGSNSLVATVSCGMPVGDLMPINRRYVVSFHSHPRLWDLQEKRLVHEWPHISSGTRSFSIIWHAELKHVAKDPANRRFAVAGDDSITIVSLDLP